MGRANRLTVEGGIFHVTHRFGTVVLAVGDGVTGRRSPTDRGGLGRPNRARPRQAGQLLDGIPGGGQPGVPGEAPGVDPESDGNRDCRSARP